MKKFEFRLARVLAWRRAQAALERNRLEQIAVRRAALLDRREALRLESRAAASALACPGAQSSRTELDVRESFSRFAHQEDARIHGEIQSVSRELDAQQVRVRAAEQASQLLEKLQDCRQAEWTAEAAKELEDLASDVFLAKWPGRR